MGVKSCSNTDCDNIMCDTYINTVGYVCNDCQKAFKQYWLSHKLGLLSHYELIKELGWFLDRSYLLERPEGYEYVDEFFRTYK